MDDQHLPPMWEGWDLSTAEPPDDDAGTSLTPEERKSADPDTFWNSRLVLKTLHEYARARRVGPWAVLGSAMARTIASVPPNVVLPATTGGVASLNLFVGLVGPSGVGKDAAQKVAKIALTIHGTDPPLEAPLGSGEGLSHMFMKPPPKGAGRDGEPEQYNRKALVRVGEIDSFAALAGRQSSTLTSQLRYAAMGEELGFFYVDVAKRMIVPSHAYRLCLIAGIQPARSGVLLRDQDGGTPQRFVWLPAGDPLAPDDAPDDPAPIIWEPPDWMPAARAMEAGNVFYEMVLPEVARKTITSARLAALRLESDSLDSHALLTRSKVAAGLALMERRIRITEEDWSLSGVVMAVSETQRGHCQRALEKAATTANRAQALAEAERSLIVEDRVEADRLKRAAATIRKRLLRLGAEGETVGKLKQCLAAKDRELFDDALNSLIITGDVVVEQVGSALRAFVQGG